MKFIHTVYHNYVKSLMLNNVQLFMNDSYNINVAETIQVLQDAVIFKSHCQVVSVCSQRTEIVIDRL